MQNVDWEKWELIIGLWPYLWAQLSIKFSDQLILKFEVMSRVEVYKTVLFKESNLSMIKPLKMRERMYGIKNFLMILKVLGGIKY